MKLRFVLPLVLLFSNCAQADYDKGMTCFSNRDYACSYTEFKESAGNGDAKSQNMLAVLYATGNGVKEDNKLAFEWHYRAAIQGYKYSQSAVGRYYARGDGVEQDYKKAFEWYKKAAIQGYEQSQFDLGVMYQLGQGVEQDLSKSLEWHQKAIDNGYYYSMDAISRAYESNQDLPKAIEWGIKSLEKGVGRDKKRITKMLMALPRSECSQLALTQLFEVKLICTTRSEMMSAVKSAGGIVIREDSNYFGDIYNSSSVLKGSSKLLMLYTENNNFAEAQYIFPSSMDIHQVTRVRDLVLGKYGEPSKSNGNVNVGEVAFSWDLNDGMLIKVQRGWPDTTTFLTITHPDNRKIMDSELKQSEKVKTQKQSDAF